MNLAPKALFQALLETKEDKDDHQIILDVIGPVPGSPVQPRQS